MLKLLKHLLISLFHNKLIFKTNQINCILNKQNNLYKTDYYYYK